MGLLNYLISIAALYATYSALRFAWPHIRAFWGARARAHRYSHATQGKAAWALVVLEDSDGGDGGIGKALCLELATWGFNALVYGYGNDNGHLAAFRAELAKEFPENRYRVAVAGTAGGDAEFVARVAKSLEDVNVTMLIMVNSSKGSKSPSKTTANNTSALTAAMLPHLKRNAPALVLNVRSVADSKSGTSVCHLCDETGTYIPLPEGVNTVTYQLGEVATGEQESSILRPMPRTMAKAVLSHAGCVRSESGHDGKVLCPYWPHDLLQTTRSTWLAISATPWRGVECVLACIKGVGGGKDKVLELSKKSV